MKISELITEITQTAEAKFGGPDSHEHVNACISVGIYSAGYGMWQVWLQQPTKRQLSFGEVTKPESIRVEEHNARFYTEAYSLLDALKQLKLKVDNEDSYLSDFESV